MISYVVGRNFGHLSRCVPNVKFLTKKRKKVTIFSFGGVHRWLKTNFRKSRVKLKSCSKNAIKTRHKKKFLRSGLIIHDWRKEMNAIKAISPKRRPIICGVYHSDLKIRSSDSPEAIKFKREVLQIANATTDVFFHMNLKQPDFIPKLNCKYVPIPLIVRKVEQSPQKVRKKLGLKKNERFILLQMGGGKGKYQYKHVNKWYKLIDKLKIDYRIVIAGQLSSKRRYRFKNPRIVHAPLFANGRDLINAADIVISKPGMGILTDCIASKKPLLLLPADSKERTVKNQMLRDLIGSDLCLIDDEMDAGDLKRRIEEVEKNSSLFTRGYSKVPTNGAEIIGRSLLKLYKKKPSQLRSIYPKLLKLTPYSVD